MDINKRLHEMFDNPQDAYRYLVSLQVYSAFCISNKDNKHHEELAQFNNYSQNVRQASHDRYLNPKEYSREIIDGGLDRSSKMKLVKDTINILGFNYDYLINYFTQQNIPIETDHITSWDSVSQYIKDNEIENLNLKPDINLINEIEDWLTENNIQGLHVNLGQDLEKSFNTLKKSVYELSDTTKIPVNELFGDTKISIGFVPIHGCTAFFQPTYDILCFNKDSLADVFAHEWLHSLDFKIAQHNNHRQSHPGL